MSVSTVATCNQALQHLWTFATLCNEVEKDCIRTNRARSFQWKWSQVCLNNCFNADSSWNIVQWVFFLSVPNGVFLSLCWAARSCHGFLCWNPLLRCCLEFIGSSGNCNAFQQSRFCNVATQVFKLATSCKLENRCCNVTHSLRLFCKFFDPKSGHQVGSAEPPWKKKSQARYGYSLRRISMKVTGLLEVISAYKMYVLEFSSWWHTGWGSIIGEKRNLEFIHMSLRKYSQNDHFFTTVIPHHTFYTSLTRVHAPQPNSF